MGVFAIMIVFHGMFICMNIPIYPDFGTETEFCSLKNTYGGNENV